MDNDLSPELRELYKEHIPQYVQELQNALSAHDIGQVEHIAHRLGPLLGSMGDSSTMRLLLSIEKDKPGPEQLSRMIEQASNRIGAALALL